MRKGLLPVIYLFAITTTSWAQQPFNEPHIYFEHLLLPGSLYFNPINDIAQDSTGLLWFASDNGVYRYDGYELLNSHDRKNLQNLKGQQVVSVLPGDDNYIYAALRQKGGIVKFKNDFSAIESFSDVMKGYQPHDLFYYPGKIGFISKAKGLFIIDEATKELITLDNEFPFYSITQSGNIIAAGSFSKIVLFENMKRSRIIELPQVNNEIRSVQITGSEIYFNTKNGIYRLNVNSEHLELLFNEDNFKEATINKVYKNKDGQLWILTDINGLYVTNRDNKLVHFEKSYYKKGSISNNRLFNIHEGLNGVIWLATGAGMNKYDKTKRYFSHLSHDPSDINTLSGDIIRGVFENSKGELFIGTDDGVINIIDSARQKIKHVPIRILETKKVVPFSFLETVPKREYLIGTSEGLLHFNSKDQKFTSLQSPKHPKDKRVRQLINYDKDHILGLSRGMVWKMNKTSKEVEKFSIPEDKNNLLIRSARTLYKDDDNSLFVGCVGDLIRYNPKTGDFNTRSIASISSDGDTLKHMILFLKKYENELYIGTFQGGLYVLDLKEENLKGKLTCYNEEHGLPDNTIYSALQDSKGFIWITTNNGLSRFDPISKNFYNYDRSNGLQGEEFNRLTHTITKRGEFIFGGIEGLNIFFPEKVYSDISHTIDPVLVGVDVINQFESKGKKSHPRYSLINIDKLTLSYNENYLTFRFASTNFSQPEKNRFYYKLENYDNTWIYSNDRTATYTGLKPGKYNFKVKAVSPDGTVSKSEASMPIEITSLWWRTWWAGLLLGMTFIGVIAYSFRKNVKKNRAIKKFLEKEIERRTGELQESKEELARLNSKKDFIFSILSHDLRSPLTTLKGFLGILIEHFDSLDEGEIKKHAVNIKNSVAKSLDLLDNTLYWSLSQMGEIAYSPSKVHLGELFEKMHGLYDLTAKKKNVNLYIELKDKIDLYADENMTYITLRNLLSNAIKFTPSGKSVYVIAKQKRNHVEIIIQDEGHGIRTEDLAKIFDQNQQFMKKGTSNEKGTGLGLTLCKKFTEMNNGTIAVESKENFGSRFIVTLPIYTEANIGEKINLS